MKASQAIKALIGKYSAICEDDSVEIDDVNLMYRPLLDALKLLEKVTPVTADESLNIETYTKVMQFISVAYVNDLRNGIKQNFKLDDADNDSLFNILYLPQIIFFQDFFSAAIANNDNAKKMAGMIFEYNRVLSDNTYQLEKDEQLERIMQKITFGDSAMPVGRLSAVRTEAVMISYMTTFYLLKRK